MLGYYDTVALKVHIYQKYRVELKHAANNGNHGSDSGSHLKSQADMNMMGQGGQGDEPALVKLSHRQSPDVMPFLSASHGGLGK